MPRGVCWLVVLGDFGRSPRMQHHAQSLAAAGNVVHVVTFAGSKPIPGLADNPKVRLHELPATPAWVTSLPPSPRLLIKFTFQFWALVWVLLFCLPAADSMLVQNPPALPTLPAARLAGTLRGVPVIVDWHNFAYTLMGMSMGRRHLLVRLAEWVERTFGRAGRYHFCVTDAMRAELERHWGVEAVVLYDRPTERFRPASVEAVHELFLRLDGKIRQAVHRNDLCCKLLSGHERPEDRDRDGRPGGAGERDDCDDGGGSGSGERSRNGQLENTLLTITSPSGDILLLDDRPGVVVSSTSWTQDEDFSILLKAASIYDRESREGTHPQLVFFVTGKGPMKEYYCQQMRELEFKRVAFRTLWLEQEDYPTLLGLADLGICLHTSSSGMDLPMKIVDMFGCYLPVCAVAYECISELVTDGSDGLLFSTPEELAQQLLDLFKGFPHNPYDDTVVLGKMRKALRGKKAFRWAENWENVALPLFEHAAKRV